MGLAFQILRKYPSASKNLANSFLFILPLMVLYELAITLSGSSVKNTADVIVKTPLEIFGRNGTLIFNLIIISIFFYAAFHLEKDKKHVSGLSVRIYTLMFLESVIYALLLGQASQFLVNQFMPSSASGESNLFGIWNLEPGISLSSTRGIGIILSIGAGVYEEIVFRLLLLSALYFIFVKMCKINDGIGGFLSIVTGAIIFSSMHYIGALSDTFSTESFLFRFMAGLILSTIFIFRGLGIAVYTHALYDVWVMLKLYS
ncbi:MAG TPA: CPBP family intramembrane glutamic endopeptidase [Candidatus Brocadiales bacterium]|nr:CPBP family intramembrane glutamic endopeptidase [Candidatus Brocadiales bacterium]